MESSKSRGEILMDGFQAARELAHIAKEAGLNRDALTLKNFVIAGVIVGITYAIYRKFKPSEVEVIP